MERGRKKAKTKLFISAFKEQKKVCSNLMPYASKDHYFSSQGLCLFIGWLVGFDTGKAGGCLVSKQCHLVTERNTLADSVNTLTGILV